jgi:transcriptional regulator with XRE-family HTH domain
MDFGSRLNRFRKQRSLTVAEVARRIHVSESTYGDWQNGRAIKGEPYIKLAGVFEISLNDLFGLSDSGSTESTNNPDEQTNDLVDGAFVADAKGRTNHRGMDANEEVQDRRSGRLPKCGA